MDKKITRKEAIKKAGVTVLAATSLVFLNTKANACTSGRIGNSTTQWGGNTGGTPNSFNFGFGNYPKPTGDGYCPPPQVPFVRPQVPWAPPTGSFNPYQFDWRSLFTNLGW